MRPEDVLKMIDAGFTSDEIRQMMEPAAAPEPTPAAPEPAPAADPEPTPAAQAEPAQPGLDAFTALNTILGKMNDKLDQMQRANLLNDASSAGMDQPTVDDIIQDLIYPGKK